MSGLLNAGARGLLVAMMIMAPTLILPNISSDTSEVVALVAIFGAVLTIIEYSASYPSIIEFRDAPPINRVRFCSIFLTVLLVALICRGQVFPDSLSSFIQAIGILVSYVLDFSYSPIRLVDYMMPDTATASQILLARSAAGLSFIISLFSLAIFVSILHFSRWPRGLKDFNVWINLPTFDPTAGSNVVARLNRDAFINVAIGLAMPYLLPLAIWAGTSLFRPVDLTSHHALIWTTAAWSFLPTSLFIRGIAMRRVAEMIAERQRKDQKATATLVPV